MTVALAALKPNQSYGGYLWHHGERQRPAVLFWNGESFPHLLGALPYAAAPADKGWDWAFEPVQEVLDGN